MNNKIKFIDLFSGMGGIRIGFEQAFKEQGLDTKCLFSSEIKSHARKVLEDNFNEIPKGDISKIKNIEDFDFLLAGFPCQAFSAAGNRDGFCDTRGTLFFEVERILKEKKPYGFILENVEGLVSHDKGNTLRIIMESLKRIGYKVSWEILNASDFGLAQSRKRIYIVGTLKEEISLKNFPKYEKKVFKDIQEHNLQTINSEFTRKLLKHFNIKELKGKAIKDKRGGKNNIHSWDFGLKGEITKEQNELLNLLFKERRKKHWAEEIGINWMDGMPLTLEQIKTFYQSDKLKEMLDDLVQKGYLKLEHPKDLSRVKKENGYVTRREYDTTKPKGYNIVTGKLSFEFSKILHPNEVTPTIVASDVEKIAIIDNDGLRKLSIKEGLRLFGYPENYKLDGVTERKAFDLLGNTVTVPIVKEISKRLCKSYMAQKAI